MIKHIPVSQWGNMGVSHAIAVHRNRVAKKRVPNPVLRRVNGVIRQR